jgi:hypothetical protein
LRLITPAEAQQINGIGGNLLSEHWLVEAPMIRISSETMDQ